MANNRGAVFVVVCLFTIYNPAQRNVGVCRAADNEFVKLQRDTQSHLLDIKWDFEYRPASLLADLVKAKTQGVTWAISPASGDKVSIDMRYKDAIGWKGKGWHYSSLLVSDGCMYFVDYAETSISASLIKHDLRTNMERWRVPIQSLNYGAGASVRNRRITLQQSGDAIYVFGLEDHGGFCDVRFVLDGRQLGHRVRELNAPVQQPSSRNR